MNKKNLLLLVFVLAGCSTASYTKKLNSINKDMDYLKTNIKDIQTNIDKTKDQLDFIKQTQPECNIDNVYNTIEILDIQHQGVENTLITLQDKINFMDELVNMEINNLRSSYNKSLSLNIILIAILIIIFFNKFDGVLNILNKIQSFFK